MTNRYGWISAAGHYYLATGNMVHDDLIKGLHKKIGAPATATGARKAGWIQFSLERGAFFCAYNVKDVTQKAKNKFVTLLELALSETNGFEEMIVYQHDIGKEHWMTLQEAIELMKDSKAGYYKSLVKKKKA